MTEDDRPRRRRQRGGGAGCSSGPGRPVRRQGSSGGRERWLNGSPGTRTFLGLATNAAQDLHDRDGLARPFLRLSALRLAASSLPAAQRLGTQYLRIDPPTPEEMARALPAAPAGGSWRVPQGGGDKLVVEGEALELVAQAGEAEPVSREDVGEPVDEEGTASRAVC